MILSQAEALVGFSLERFGHSLAVEAFVLEGPLERERLRDVAEAVVAGLVAEGAFYREFAFGVQRGVIFGSGPMVMSRVRRS